MKAYIQSYQNGVPHNYNFMNAWQGFKEMGFEIIPFSDAKTLKTSEGNDIIVGYVNTVRSRLRERARQ